MSIEKKEIEYEKSKLKDTQQWINEQIMYRDKMYDEISRKVSSLKKSSGGRYNEELELSLATQQVAVKNLKKFTEAEESPYFTRIDFKEDRREKEIFYIGKFGLSDEKEMEEKVIDWRSPIADLYYSGTQGRVEYEAPMGIIQGELSLKRKFLIKEGKLNDAFDEGINEIILKSGLEEEKGNSLVDEFLRINLEESISSKLKDVVSTIQKEQNEIIRASMKKPIIVQGSAGSGKTTIALHRLAYLLYRHKNFLSGDDILVIAPNKLFLDYISEVLPNLGVDKVRQITFDEMCKNVLKIKTKIYTKDIKLAEILEKNIATDNYRVKSSKFKGSRLFKIIVDRYIKYIEFYDSKIDNIVYENYVLFYSKEIRRLYLKDMVHLPLNKRKEEIKRYFKKKIKNRMSEVLNDIEFNYGKKILEIKNSMDDSDERRKVLVSLYDERDKKKLELKNNARKSIDSYFKNWIVKDIEKLYYNLFDDKDIFNKITDNNISDSFHEFLFNEISENRQKGYIDSDDLCVMMYLKLNIDGIDESLKYKHIVIDEAQDYSIFQFEVINYLSLNKSMTIVGDIGQGIYTYKALKKWNDLIKNVFKGESSYVSLTQSYRSTVEIIDFANKVLIKQNDYIKPASPVLRHGKKPEVIMNSNDDEFVNKLEDIIKEIENMGKNSIAIIGRTYDECEKIYKLLNKRSSSKWYLVKDTDKMIKLDKIIIPSYLTKGLEFDCSVIYNCNDVNYSDSEINKKLLYVSLTRALHLEYIFYRGEISPLIKDTIN